MVKLQHALALLAPFALVALFHHMRFATASINGPSLASKTAKRAGRTLNVMRSAAQAVAVGETLPSLTLAAQFTGHDTSTLMASKVADAQRDMKELLEDSQAETEER